MSLTMVMKVIFLKYVLLKDQNGIFSLPTFNFIGLQQKLNYLFLTFTCHLFFAFLNLSKLLKKYRSEVHRV